MGGKRAYVRAISYRRTPQRALRLSVHYMYVCQAGGQTQSGMRSRTIPAFYWPVQNLQNNLIVLQTLPHGYSLKSAQQGLSNEYQINMAGFGEKINSFAKHILDRISVSGGRVNLEMHTYGKIMRF